MNDLTRPKEKHESTEEFTSRIYRDAIENRFKRIDYLNKEVDREKRMDLLEGMTGLAIDLISNETLAVCCDCGKIEHDEPLNCYECGCEDFLQVWHLKTGEYYVTAERYMKRAINVTIKK